ncbi:MAG: glutaredoxin family protein [Clostridia bacterium]|nr:glutaredoxin family protein [Bacillota bacterium]MDA8212588.1 glutaredoxin family protein [Clostridia bacterium]
MKEFLSQKGVSYREYNVASDTKARDEMLAKSGKMSVPTIVVGNQVVVGFDRAKLEQLLH